MKAKSASAGIALDKMIHERARLMILTHLATSGERETGFTELRDSLGFTPGNLSVQLKTLEEAAYIRTEKRFVDRKPFTGVRLTPSGAEALESYLVELESLISSLRKKT